MQAAVVVVPVDTSVQGKAPQGGGVPGLVLERYVDGAPAQMQPGGAQQQDCQRQYGQRGKAPAESVGFGHTDPSFQAGSARRMARSAHQMLNTVSAASTTAASSVLCTSAS